MAKNTTTAENGIEVYTNKIYQLLDEYMANRGIEDFTKESQNKWNAFLLYVGQYFKKSRVLFIEGDTLDIKKVYDLADLYISLCYEMAKEVSLLGFSKFTHIDTQTFYNWQNEKISKERLSCASIGIVQKIQTEHEESLANMLTTGNGNPIGRIAVLRKNFPNNGWNEEKRITYESKQSLTAAELPKLGNISQKDE